MSNNAVAQDQARFWQLFVQAISGHLPGSDPKNFIAAAGRVDSHLGSETEVVALTDAYNVGNTIPSWGLTWSGAFNNKLFDIYQQWVRDIVPAGSGDSGSGGSSSGGGSGDPLDTQIEDLRSKIALLSSDISKINQGIYSDWLNEVCAELDSTGKACSVYFTNPPDPTWANFEPSKWEPKIIRQR
ncbi:hypothetical protein [Paenibacillus sp. AR247]|uniref:hypothetical protein n=1 Tax=Paenibacillus sp. AR247 TaxID=1631599 RepID=UPI0011B0D827|nr:hypothetical protein [Paenibacillus sp. AR247]